LRRYVSDFASFKPPSLPADNPADYSYFFDTVGRCTLTPPYPYLKGAWFQTLHLSSEEKRFQNVAFKCDVHRYNTGGRRRCYVAPERFRDHPFNTAAEQGENDADADVVTEAADVFSLGCVLGELFLDGSALFDLSQLLAFRRGEHDPSASLQAVADGAARDLVLHMTARDPGERLSAAAYLERWSAPSEKGAASFFPAYFRRLHDFCAGLMTKDADQTAAAVAAEFGPLMAEIVGEEFFRFTTGGATGGTGGAGGAGGSGGAGGVAGGRATAGAADGGGRAFAEAAVLSSAAAAAASGGGGAAAISPFRGTAGVGTGAGAAAEEGEADEDEGLGGGGGGLGGSLGLDRPGMAPSPPTSPSPFWIGDDGGDAMMHDIGKLLGDPSSPTKSAQRGGGNDGLGGGDSPGGLHDMMVESPISSGMEASAFLSRGEGGGGGAAAAAAGSEGSGGGATQLAEVAWETVFENQLRESPGAPWKESDGASSSSSADRRREDVQLPRECGWRWSGEWEVAEGGRGSSFALCNRPRVNLGTTTERGLSLAYTCPLVQASSQPFTTTHEAPEATTLLSASKPQVLRNKCEHGVT
jgi:hypothetical protein